MKFGLRTPSLKRSLKARTTGRIKRSVKKALIPGHGQKGAGWIKNPKKAVYNKIYKKTTFSLKDIFKQTNQPNAKIKHSADFMVSHIFCDYINEYKSTFFTDTNSVICKMIVGRYRLPLSLRTSAHTGVAISKTNCSLEIATSLRSSQ